MRKSSRILGRPTGRAGVHEHVSQYPQKKFRLSPEQVFQLQMCSARWDMTETRIIEEALRCYIDQRLTEKDANRVYPAARRFHRRWVRAYDTGKTTSQQNKIKEELQKFVRGLRE